jgi:23S rRNA pseudouridine1911/1915/1917 synthase
VIAAEFYVVSIPTPEPVEVQGDPVSFQVIYEDESVVVVNKPRGIVVHPAAGHERNTLVNGLVFRGVSLSYLGGALRPGVVHRIDKDTSGLLVLAKTDGAYHGLAEQFREHTMQRRYLALVHGVVPHDKGRVDGPIGRDPTNRKRMAVVERGKPAITHFAVLERFQAYTFLDLHLETGRTHQIRVHMAFIGHPVAGDPVYGPRHTLMIEGQALHAATLGFRHPENGKELCFTAPLPEDMEGLLRELRS